MYNYIKQYFIYYKHYIKYNFSGAYIARCVQ